MFVVASVDRKEIGLIFRNFDADIGASAPGAVTKAGSEALARAPGRKVLFFAWRDDHGTGLTGDQFPFQLGVVRPALRSQLVF